MDNKNRRVSTTADRIKERMKELNMKQVDVVYAANVDKGALSHYISGRYEPKDKVMFRLAKALDVSEMWLWGYDVPKERKVLSNEKITIPENLNENIKWASDIVIRLGNDDKFCESVKLLDELNDDGLTQANKFLCSLVEKLKKKF